MPFTRPTVLSKSDYYALLDHIESANLYQMGRGVVEGLEMSPGAEPHTVSVSAGIHSALKLTYLSGFSAVVPPNETVYLWLNENGDTTTTVAYTDPGGSYLCLGRVVDNGASVTVSRDGRNSTVRWTGLDTLQLGDAVRVGEQDGSLYLGNPNRTPDATDNQGIYFYSKIVDARVEAMIHTPDGEIQLTQAGLLLGGSGSGGMAVGQPVGLGTNNAVLYTSGSKTLASDSNFTFSAGVLSVPTAIKVANASDGQLLRAGVNGEFAPGGIQVGDSCGGGGLGQVLHIGTNNTLGSVAGFEFAAGVLSVPSGVKVGDGVGLTSSYVLMWNGANSFVPNLLAVGDNASAGQEVQGGGAHRVLVLDGANTISSHSALVFNRSTMAFSVGADVSVTDGRKLSLANAGGFANTFGTGAGQGAAISYTLPESAPTLGQFLRASSVSGQDVTLEWLEPPAGVTSLTGGSGITATPATIVSTGSFALDQAFSPAWTGQHTFSYAPATGVGANHTLAIRSVPFAQATGAVVEMGAATAFDGTTSGFFNGNANGTYIAVNAANGYTGDLISLRTNNAVRFAITGAGGMTFGTASGLLTSASGTVTAATSISHNLTWTGTQAVNNTWTGTRSQTGTSATTSFTATYAWNPTGNPGSPTTHRALDLVANVGGTGGTNVLNVGQRIQSVLSATVGAASIVGQTNEMSVTVGNTLPEMTGYTASLTSGHAASVVTLGCGFRATLPTQTGTFTTYNGVRVDTVASGTFTNAYGMFVDAIGARGTNGASLMMLSDNTAKTGLLWSTSATAPDANSVNLYRSAGDTLRTDDSLSVGGHVIVAGSASSRITVTNTATAPSNTSTPAAWMLVNVNGVDYRIPLYQ